MRAPSAGAPLHPRLATLDLNLLVVLEVLLEERNVTRAAARLGLTQPGVSTALARLRAALGDPLLVGGPRGMEPTPSRSGTLSASDGLGACQATGHHAGNACASSKSYSCP